MAQAIPKKIQFLLENLSKSQLVSFSFEPTIQSVHLEFTSGHEGHDVVIQLFQIAHFVLSKDPDDNEGCFYVGEVKITPLENGGLEILSVSALLNEEQ